MTKKKEKKVGFFKRLKLAIFNMEEYGMFLTERFWKAFGYFAILMLLISISLTVAYHYRVSNKLLSYIKNEMPEVSFNDGVLKSEQNVEAYDSTFNFRVFINTDDAVSEETLKGYDEKIGKTELALMFFKDKATIASYMVDPSITDLTQEIKEEDIRVDVYRSSGNGGQGVNTTDSAVRISHLPSGIVVCVQNERSQIKNKEIAMKILKSKLYKMEVEKREKEIASLKGNANIDFGSQIRNYVLEPYSLVKDLRSNYETSNPEKVLDGDLYPFIEAYLRIKR